MLMIFNVASLLNGPVGDEIRFHFAHQTLEHEGLLFRDVEARGKLMRTDRTVLAQAAVKATNDTECARCLEFTAIDINLEFVEEFAPSNVDLVIRRSVPHQEDDVEDEALTIDESNVLDMSQSLWQTLGSAMPMMPLCNDDCLGFCSECLTNLNSMRCRCQESVNSNAGNSY